MNWTEVLNYLFQAALIPLILAGAAFLIAYVNSKTKEMKQKTDSDIAKKYLDMLDDTITKTVIATTQTYVQALKDKNAFDEAAQKEAFKRTYNAIINTLTDEAKLYLQTVVADLETYITTRIEYNVSVTKLSYRK